jgi:hypothetical protein
MNKNKNFGVHPIWMEEKGNSRRIQNSNYVIVDGNFPCFNVDGLSPEMNIGKVISWFPWNGSSHNRSIAFSHSKTHRASLKSQWKDWRTWYTWGFVNNGQWRLQTFLHRKSKMSLESMNILTWNRQSTFAIEASDITQWVKPSRSMKETQTTNPWKKRWKTWPKI